MQRGYSGGFVGTVFVDLFALTSAVLTESDPEERDRTVRSCQVAILLQIWYMVGDWNLLFRMSRKDTVLMHAAAISRVTFGAAFLVAPRDSQRPFGSCRGSSSAS